MVEPKLRLGYAGTGGGKFGMVGTDGALGTAFQPELFSDRVDGFARSSELGLARPQPDGDIGAENTLDERLGAQRPREGSGDPERTREGNAERVVGGRKPNRVLGS